MAKIIRTSKRKTLLPLTRPLRRLSLLRLIHIVIMKFALCSPAVEYKDLVALAERCRTLGYDGVDLQSPTIPAAELRQIFQNTSAQIACITVTNRFIQNVPADLKTTDAVRSALDLAHHTGCHLVKIPDPQPSVRQSAMTTISAMADWLRPLAILASDLGINLLIENGPTFSTARPLWMLTERLDHPAIGVCWNVQETIAAGESPAVTVPTLNSRIRYVQMTAGIGHDAIIRLRGIGYTGWIAFHGDSADAEAFLNTTKSPAQKSRTAAGLHRDEDAPAQQKAK
jgi:sugar phosphate isomerase/epimerase